MPVTKESLLQLIKELDEIGGDASCYYIVGSPKAIEKIKFFVPSCMKVNAIDWITEDDKIYICRS